MFRVKVPRVSRCWLQLVVSTHRDDSPEVRRTSIAARTGSRWSVESMLGAKSARPVAATAVAHAADSHMKLLVSAGHLRG